MHLPEIDMKSVSHPYPETTMFGAVELSAKKFPDAPAYDFMDKITSFKDFMSKIESAAKAFLSFGIKQDDAVTICMPNTPQAIICLYALNRIGAVANMVHPLSSQKNITFYLDFSESKMILTLDQFYTKVKCACEEAENRATIIVARIQDELPAVKSFLYKKFKNKENLKYPDDKTDITWADFIKCGSDILLPPIKYVKDKTSVILYSGGTSGTPKGIQLTDFNFNALGMQIAEICGCNLTYGCKFLSVMPIFHGFGLGIGIHTILENGAMCILIPQFTKESYAQVVLKKKPNFIAGVPTLFEALLRVDAFKNADLSFLIGVFSGGDALNYELKKRVDAFFKEHNANLQIREGYGLTECVTASCVTPVDKEKAGSIGLPLRDMTYKIVEPGTFTELSTGAKGEIIISGPTLMSGYMKNEEETEKTLRTDENGQTWLFTGDLGSIDDEGFVFFHQRIKRMIITSGYNVYPSQIEKILDKHPDIDCSCVIGVPDPYKMQKIRAYISLKDGIDETEAEKDNILKYCSAYLDIYEMPSEIIFRRELPKTLVGKVAYHTLEKEALAEADVLFETIKDLLGTDTIDFSDSFINLGGNSLKAIELKDILEEKGYSVQLSSIFNSADIDELKKSLKDSRRSIRTTEYSSVMKLTNAQQRIYSAQMLAPESTMYNITFVFKAENVDIDRLEKALNKLIDRHESLRTRFENRNGKIVQVIENKAAISIEKLCNEDFSSFVRPFDLCNAPLLRVGYCENTLVFDMHHIISDGGTLPVFFRELNECYMNRPLGVAVQYGEFAAGEWYSEDSEKYWLDVFNDEIPVLNLNTDYPRKEMRSFEGSAFYDSIDIELHDKIIHKSKELNITPYVFYMTCFNILLGKLTNSEDIVVGIPVSGRNSHFLNTVGMFVNTVAVRNKPCGDKTVRAFFDDVKISSVAALDNQNYPFGELVNKLKAVKTDRNPIFDVMFAYQREEMTDVVLGDKKVEVLPVPALSSKYDITFNIMPRHENVVILLEYCTALFREQTIRHLVDLYKSVLQQCLCESTFIKNVSVMSYAESIKLLKEFNLTKHRYDVDEGATLYSLFEKTAKENCEKICIKTAEGQMSFGKLLCVSENLDAAIRKITHGNKSVIAVIAERSREMYSAIYGIIRGGNAYLPIDPEYPIERIEYILENSNAAAVICQEKFISLAGNTPYINMTEFIENSDRAENVLSAAADENDTAYVIYTSGSTGNPKGARVSHKSAVNRILWMHDKYPLCSDDVILQKTPYTFDVSVWEHFWWGIAGGSLAVSKPGEHFLPARILDETEKCKVTHLHFVPSVFELFLNYLESHREELNKFNSVKYVFLSGEALSASLVQRFYELYDYNKITLHNLYGPTECAVDVTYYDCLPEEVDPVPIGKPIYNTQMHIVDKYMNRVPVGVQGELCIAGVNVGQGYLNNEALTNEKFIDNPFGDGKLYKTGDLAYWRDDGNIIFCGRNDFQVKVRGLRIELGEIENAISEIEGINQSVVIVRKDKDDRQVICAFYTGEEKSVKDIRCEISEKLPVYMLPHVFTHIEEIPLTSSGKINRNVLMNICVVPDDTAETEAPVNSTEKAICDIFSRVLGIDRIGRSSNFFELGGTSLSVLNCLAEQLLEGVSVAEFMRNPTPQGLASIVRSDYCRYEYLEPLHISENSVNSLILIPFAGGGAEAYSELVREIKHNNADTSVYFIRYLHSAEECMNAATEIENVLPDKNLIFYSHCVGAAVALKLIEKLECDGFTVKKYFAGAIVPQSFPRGKNFWRIVPDFVLKRILNSANAKLDGVPTEKQKEILKSFRYDTDTSNKMLYESAYRIKVPLTVILSSRDIFTRYYTDVRKDWSVYAENVEKIHVIDSDSHYFQTDNAHNLYEIISE